MAGHLDCSGIPMDGNDGGQRQPTASDRSCTTSLLPGLSEVIACKAEDVGRHHSLRAGSALAIRSAGQVNLLDRIVLLIKSNPSRRASSKGGAITHGSTGLSPSRKLISTARASSLTLSLGFIDDPRIQAAFSRTLSVFPRLSQLGSLGELYTVNGPAVPVI